MNFFREVLISISIISFPALSFANTIEIPSGVKIGDIKNKQENKIGFDDYLKSIKLNVSEKLQQEQERKRLEALKKKQEQERKRLEALKKKQEQERKIAADAPVPAADAPVPAADAPVPAADAPVPAADAPVPAASSENKSIQESIARDKKRIDKRLSDLNSAILGKEKDFETVMCQKKIKSSLYIDYSIVCKKSCDEEILKEIKRRKLMTCFNW